MSEMAQSTQEGVETMHADVRSGFGPTDEEIVRSAWQHADSGGNDRRLDLAWAAGFFDGEGYIGINPARRSRNNTRSYTLVTTVGQVGPEPIHKLQSILGGRVYRYEKRPDNRGAVSVWQASSGSAAMALSMMLPFLVVKSEQAALALEFQRTKGSRPGAALTDEEAARQRAYSNRLKELRAKIKANS